MLPLDPDKLTLPERFEALGADFFWLPAGVSVVARPELIYCYSARRSPLFNAVDWVRAVPSRVDRLVAEVDAAHGDRPSRWTLTDHSGGARLEEAIAAAGWTAGHVHDLRVAAAEGFRARPTPEVVVRKVETLDELRVAVEVCDVAFGKAPGSASLADLADDLERCTGPESRVGRFVAYDAATGEPMASAGATVSPQLGVGFLWAGGTVEAQRGRGAYSALVAARVEFARQRGIGHVGLFARQGTSSPIVEKQGFERLGAMVHWNRNDE